MIKAVAPSGRRVGVGRLSALPVEAGRELQLREVDLFMRRF